MASQGRNENDDSRVTSPEIKRPMACCIQAAGTVEAIFGRSVQQSAFGRQPEGSDLLSLIAEVTTWKRPLRSTTFFIATNAFVWFVALGSWRVCYLLALGLIVLAMVQMIRDMVISRQRGAHVWRSMSESWEVIDSSLESRAEVGQLTDSWMSCKLFLQEMSSFKQHNPGKFCLLVCSLCTFFAVLGRYVPGIVISYVAVLAVFLWPLLSSNEFGPWVEPVLQKLDFGVGDFLQRIRENHEKRILQRQEEHSDADLSALFTEPDSSNCKELPVSDAEASWTENGTFDLPEAHTPEAENSEDLDQPGDRVEEAFPGALPSVGDGTGIHEDDEELSPGLPALPPLPPTRRAPGNLALELVDRMAGDVIAAAVTAAIQEQPEAHSDGPRPVPGQQPPDFAEDSDSEVEDFVVLDQSELEQLEGELGLERAAREAPSKPSKPSFFSRLLGRR